MSAGRADAGGTPTLIAALGVIGILTVGLAVVGVLLASQLGKASVSGPPEQITAAPTTSLAATATPTSRTSVAPTAEPSPVGEWQTFTAPDGSFSVSLPGDDEPVKYTQTTEAGSYTMEVILYGAVDTAGSVYMAGWVDLPESVTDGDEETLLDLFGSGFAYGSGGTIVDRYETTMSSHPARHVTMEQDGRTMEMRYCLAGSRLYILAAQRSKHGNFYPQHFMATFQLD